MSTCPGEQAEQNRRSKPVHGCDGGDGELGAAAAGLENGDGDGEGSMRGGGQGSADDGTMVARRRRGHVGRRASEKRSKDGLAEQGQVERERSKE